MSFFSLIKKNKYWYLYLLMMAFLLLKMARGVFGVVSQGGLWNGIQILFMLIGISFFFSKYNNKLSPIGILLFYSIWAMFVSLLNMFIHPILSLSSWFYYIAIPCAPLVLLIFYCITQREDIYDFSVLIKMTYYVLIIMFYYSMTNYRTNSFYGEYIAFSDIYFPLALLPIVLLQTYSKRSFIPLLAMVIGVIVSGKRGGLVTVALIAFVYYFVSENRKKRNSFLMILVFAGLIAVSSFLIDIIDSNYGLHTIDRMMNAMDDGGSGRIIRWHKTLSAIGMSNMWELLFGHGFWAIFNLVKGRAHNDFVEIFYDYGFITVVLYSMFFLSLITVNVLQYKKKYPKAKYLTCSIIVSLTLAMVSFFIVDPTYSLCSMFTTGLLLGDWSKYNMNNKL